MREIRFVSGARSAVATLVPMLVLALGPAGASIAQESYADGTVGVEGPNTVEFFLGGVRGDHRGRDETAFAAGVSYRYSLSEATSVGLLAEYSGDPFDAWIVGVPLVFSLGGGWQFTAMPGAELEGGTSEFLFRAGIGYEVEMEGYFLTPEVNADFVDGDVSLVVGLGIGFRF